METIKFFVKGTPTSYSAKEPEQIWKNALKKQIPMPNLKGIEKGVIIKFRLRSIRYNKQKFDLDNFCDPVFSVLVNHVGWFGKSRTNINWWHATKELNSEEGCEIEINTSKKPSVPESPPFFNDRYTGTLPKSAKHKETIFWCRESINQQNLELIPNIFVLYLSFINIKINLGNVTGNMKSMIDCLHPVWGYSSNRPDDHKIQELIVDKRSDQNLDKEVLVKIWDAIRL